jgi:hypothetical protein
MKALKITFKEPATLRIFTDSINHVGPSGPNVEVTVPAGEVWYAPTSQGNSLKAAAQKNIPVEKDSYDLFHDLASISRTTDDQPLWTQIAAVNKGIYISEMMIKPQLPLFETQVITGKTVDTTHEDYFD